MNISSTLESRIAPDQVLRYKQRLVAMTELFDADLVICLSRSDDGWSLVAVDGTLVTEDWQDCLPLRLLNLKLEARQNFLGADYLGPDKDLSNISLPLLGLITLVSVFTRKDLCFVAARRVRKGAFRPADMESLARYLAAFDNAGV